jgi:hypothetical protein
LWRLAAKSNPPDPAALMGPGSLAL